MKFPKFTISGRAAALRAVALLALGFALASTGLAQKNFSKDPKIAQTYYPSLVLEKCRNGSASNPGDCTKKGTPGWSSSPADSSNSHWAESQYVPYRLRFSNLNNPATHSVVISYSVLNSGYHAIDYLGTYNLTEFTANPCDGVSGCSGATNGDDQFPIPVDPDIAAFGAPFPQMPNDGKFTIWGGDITAVEYVGNSHVDNDRKIKVTFTATKSNPVLAWSAHIAWLGEWGPSSTAGDIGGYAYVMSVTKFDGYKKSIWCEIKTNAVISTGVVRIIKDVIINGNPSATSNALFTFTATGLGNTSEFQLADDGNPGNNTATNGVMNFGQQYPVTVTESALPSGWSLLNLVCSEVKGSVNGSSLANSTPQAPGAIVNTANIIVEEGEIVTCTFTNSFTTPTAAPASVMGRVVGFGGRGVSGARVTMWDTSSGQLITRTTNSFGYYRFDNLAISHFYVATVEKKGMTFANDTRSFSLEDDFVGLNFFAN